MFEIIPHLFLLSLGLIFGGITFLCNSKSRKGKALGLIVIFLGALGVYVPIQTFIDMGPINDNKIITQGIVQTATLNNGQTKQYILNHNEEKMWLNPNYWKPETTYYEITYKQGTLLWFFNYEDQQFTYFTVEFDN